MTTGSPEPPHDSRAWAAKQLGLRADAAPAEARAALLERLPEEDFVPPPELPEAVAVLCERRFASASRAPVYAQFLLDQEEDLRAEVEDFAARFFEIPLTQRRSQWQELTTRCQTSLRLRARLSALAPGLAIDPARISSEDPLVQKLGEQVCGLFLLRPAERATQRLDLLRPIQSDVTTWQNAARRLQKAYPQVAALQAEFVSELASREWTQKLLAKRRRRPLRLQQGVPALRPGGTRSLPVNGTFSWRIAAFLVGLALGLIRLTSGSGSHSTDAPYSPPPPIVIPEWEHPPPLDEPWRTLSKTGRMPKDFNERLKAILEEQQEDAPKPDHHSEPAGREQSADKDDPAGRPRPDPVRPPAP